MRTDCGRGEANLLSIISRLLQPQQLYKAIAALNVCAL